MKKILSLILTVLILASLAVPALADVNMWYCPRCGRANNGLYCPQDGTKNPLSEGGSGANSGSDPGYFSGNSGYSKRTLTVGEVITLGRYEQDNLAWDGTEAIEWLVLDVQGDKALLLSRYGLESRQPFNSKYGNTTWADCSLRSWLNGTFYQNAFSASEQAAIQLVLVDNGSSQWCSYWNTSGGNNTYDRIFLLSYAECVRYLRSDAARRCAPTDAARIQGSWTYDHFSPEGKPSSPWWLRTPGPSQCYAGCVDLAGKAGYYNAVGNSYVMVRPAMWVDMGQL